MSDELIEAVAKALHNTGWDRAYWVDAAQAVLTAIEAAGFVVVPVEPTEKMLTKGGGFNEMQRFNSGRIYAAMLSARPKVTT